VIRLGVFIPTGNNGWIPSATSPQYLPTYDLNRSVVRRAEEFGFDFALCMVKFRGFGGDIRYWDYTLETFTIMSALAAVTDRIKLYASVGVLSLHPAMVARMASTIDSVAPGRFGINIVSGWNRQEYAQMGMWPGDEYYEYRYDYSTEFVTILNELWKTGRASSSSWRTAGSAPSRAPISTSSLLDRRCAGDSSPLSSPTTTSPVRPESRV
jgi:pyrimidine oxygenase